MKLMNIQPTMCQALGLSSPQTPGSLALFIMVPRNVCIPSLPPFLVYRGKDNR